MAADLRHSAPYRRSFAAKILTRLSASDPEERIFSVFPRLTMVMGEDRPEVARPTLQSIWRVGLAGSAQRKLVIAALEVRFFESAHEEVAFQVRTDVIASLRRLADATDDEGLLRARANALIETEANEKFRGELHRAWQNQTRCT